MSEEVKTVARARPLKDLAPGANRGPFRAAVTRAAVRTTKAGDPYLEIEVRDRTATWTTRCWDGADRVAEFAPGTVVEFSALAHDPSFGPKFGVDDYRVVPPGEYAAHEFVPSLPASQVERLWNEFHGFLDSILNPHLQALRAKIWGDERRAAKYKWHVSAVGHHHNYMGGNIEHVVGIMRAVEALTTSYPQIDRELVLFGAAVHDLGKLDEYAVDATIRVTDEGKLRGHLVMGAETVAQLVEELRAEGHEFPKTLQDHLVHMILSHHGRGAWGSPKPPATPEAFLLHQADYIDSQVKGFLQYVEENKDASADGWARYFDRDIGESRNVRVDWPDEPA